MKKVYIIFNNQWHEGQYDDERIMFGARVYLSEEKAKKKCAELNEKFEKEIADRDTTLRRRWTYDVMYLDEEEL